MAIIRRVRYWWSAFDTVGRVLSGAYFVFGLLLTLREFMSPAVQGKWSVARALGYLPHLSAAEWVTGALIILLGGFLEGTYRRHRAESDALERFLDDTPRISRVDLSRIGPRPLHFDLLVETWVQGEAGIGDWSAKLVTRSGESTTLNGLIATHGVKGAGVCQLTVSFPYGGVIPDRAALVGALVAFMQGSDMKRRKVIYQPEAPVLLEERLPDFLEREALESSARREYDTLVLDVIKRQDAVIQKAIPQPMVVSPGTGELTVIGHAPTVVTAPYNELEALQLEAAATHEAVVRLGDLFKTLGYATQRSDGTLEFPQDEVANHPPPESESNTEEPPLKESSS